MPRTKPFQSRFSIPCPSCGVGMKALRTRLVRPDGGEPRLERYRYCGDCNISLKTAEVVVGIPKANRARIIEKFLRPVREAADRLREECTP